MQYYDWESNTCHRLDWLEENEFSHVVSDTEIPAEIDPSQMEYFPDFEPERLAKLVTHVNTELNVYFLQPTLSHIFVLWDVQQMVMLVYVLIYYRLLKVNSS